MAPVRVKICGLTSLPDARAAVDAGAEALGFNFYARSRRYVSPAVVAQIADHLPPAVCRVGVFVNATREEVIAVAREARLTALQFHGDEAPDFCTGWPFKVLKAVRVRDAGAVRDAARYAVDFILVDAYVEGQPGGTGNRIAPALLTGFDRNRLILAGGLTPETVAEAVRTVRPFGVDVASGVESAPGHKDAALMKRFVANAHAA
jgi:phosphoribosylanthranilate isomerase